jgi:hypothetical protein
LCWRSDVYTASEWVEFMFWEYFFTSDDDIVHLLAYSKIGFQTIFEHCRVRQGDIFFLIKTIIYSLEKRGCGVSTDRHMKGTVDEWDSKNCWINRLCYCDYDVIVLWKFRPNDSDLHDEWARRPSLVLSIHHLTIPRLIKTFSSFFFTQPLARAESTQFSCCCFFSSFF